MQCIRHFSAIKAANVAKVLITNRLAEKNFNVLHQLTCGIKLEPSEVKSAREQKFAFSNASIDVHREEMFLYDSTIPVWRNGILGSPDPNRVRKLLLNKREIKVWEKYLLSPNTLVKPYQLIISESGWIKLIIVHCEKTAKIDHRQRDMVRAAKQEINKY